MEKRPVFEGIIADSFPELLNDSRCQSQEDQQTTSWTVRVKLQCTEDKGAFKHNSMFKLVLEKAEEPEIKLVNPKGNQP